MDRDQSAPDGATASGTVGTGGSGAAPGAAGRPASGTTGALVGAVVLYTGARLALVAVIAGVLLLLGVPLLVAMLLGIIVALPLSLLLFRPLRARLNREIDAASEARRTQRDRLRAELRGDGSA